jgi:putative radical SAM enzyme (TIGR03279 family)
MKIKSIQKGSMASRMNISPGDELAEIDGHPVRDLIDYRFSSTEYRLELKLLSPQGAIKRIRVKKEPDQDLGLEFYPDKNKSCKNNCIFCFVHQLPKGLRRALYFKDEDFRLSFLHGNFITLTNTSSDDIERIVRQRLSPLYVSVHTTDEKLRKEILGNPKIPDIMPQIRKLAEGRIGMHTQIVLCPGINDGEYLKQSVGDLSSLYPNLKSLALVPVGLTRFRSRLPVIRPVGVAYSRHIIGQVDGWQKTFRRELGTGFIYAADEFYTKSGLPIPGKRYYDDFHQIENGVGMMCQFLDDFQANQKLLPKKLKKEFKITLVTGVSASKLIKQMVQKHLRSIPGLRIIPVEVKNDFFGNSVTVTGLLTGADIIATLKKTRNLGNLIVLPPNCVNQDGFLLDDSTPEKISHALERRVILGSYDLARSLKEAVDRFGQ